MLEVLVRLSKLVCGRFRLGHLRGAWKRTCEKEDKCTESPHNALRILRAASMRKC
jgi:hypothetical protein